ncbi:unnamed protein product [Macrosiphum euphorbiae]|uniref:Uncharacterized protein n=1 Tax=Macrosiphum euphorbiae TaxID=13131 RepID=A0AAV0VSF4_9HEMI|nr:unnamed protein product [Macrosiphum euphorbiae]
MNADRARAAAVHRSVHVRGRYGAKHIPRRPRDASLNRRLCDRRRCSLHTLPTTDVYTSRSQHRLPATVQQPPAGGTNAAGAGANGRLVGGDRHGPPRRTTDHIGRDAVLLLLLLPDDGTDLLVVDTRCGRANTSRR